MEVKKLPGLVVLLVAISMLIGTGILILFNFGDAARGTRVIADESVTAYISAEAETALSETEVSSVTTVVNGTVTLTDVTNYNVTIGDTSTTISVDADYNGSAVNVTYVHYYDTDATTAADNFSTAVTAISNTWMALIVTILALSIILYLVLTSFGAR